jgi:hypothetical protein
LLLLLHYGLGLCEYRSIHSRLLKTLGTSTGASLRFCPSDLIKIKGVPPAHAHRERAQASQFESNSIPTYLFSQARFRFFRFID